MPLLDDLLAKTAGRPEHDALQRAAGALASYDFDAALDAISATTFKE